MTDVILAMFAVGAMWAVLVFITRRTDNMVLEPALDAEFVARMERFSVRLCASVQAFAVSMEQAGAALSRLHEAMLTDPEGWDGE